MWFYWDQYHILSLRMQKHVCTKVSWSQQDMTSNLSPYLCFVCLIPCLSCRITFPGFVLTRFVEPWAGSREGSGGENAGMWGSDITGRYITASQVHCQAGPSLCATHICIVLSPLECFWTVSIEQTNIEWLVSPTSGLTLTYRQLKQIFLIRSKHDSSEVFLFIMDEVRRNRKRFRKCCVSPSVT